MCEAKFGQPYVLNVFDIFNCFVLIFEDFTSGKARNLKFLTGTLDKCRNIHFLVLKREISVTK
jgi:hypothetical protein